MICPYSPACSGCTEWPIPYEEQLQRKMQHLLEGLMPMAFEYLPEIKVHSVGPNRLRDRLDFTIEDRRIGLYSHQTRKILDLPECYLLSPELENFYQNFRQIIWPVSKGSFRLRIGPQNEKGAWLDFSNLDVKSLLAEKKTLRKLQELAFVEIGQRRKSLVAQNDQLSLGTPILKNWSRSSYLGAPISLYSTVGSFSQSGHASNELITSRVAHLSREFNFQRGLEYGAGNGNLTFPVLSEDNHMTVIETDTLALKGLQKAAEKLELMKRITFHNTREDLSLSTYDFILANPPRSGASEFFMKLEPVIKINRPQYILYMSCFPKSFFLDAQILKQLSYRLQNLEIIDQFPQSQHYEIISAWAQS